MIAHRIARHECCKKSLTCSWNSMAAWISTAKMKRWWCMPAVEECENKSKFESQFSFVEESEQNSKFCSHSLTHHLLKNLSTRNPKFYSHSFNLCWRIWAQIQILISLMHKPKFQPSTPIMICSRIQESEQKSKF